MRTCAIICEYNPFHNGHKYLIQKVQKAGITHIVAIMSGNFTQRGTPAVMSKFTRAHSALLCGCDLVLELPTIYSASRAQNFAFGGVYIANALNCVDYLSFGCEIDDIDLLVAAAHASMSQTMDDALQEKLAQGSTFAKARQEAISLKFGNEIADVFSQPNNNLAIEYINSLHALGSSIVPLPIKRHKAFHRDTSFSDEFCSSSYIRENLCNNEIAKFMPSESFEIVRSEIKNGAAPASINFAERAILYKLKTMSKHDFASLPDISEGLDVKLYNEAQKSRSLEELYHSLKSKRYTLARLQRIILSAYLGIENKDLMVSLPYIKVLGFNKKGAEILHIAKKESFLPIITKYSDVKRLQNTDCLGFFERECHFTDLYSLMLSCPNNLLNEKASHIIKI